MISRKAGSSGSPWWVWPLLILGFGLCVAETAIFGLGLASGRIAVGGFDAINSSEIFDPIAALLAAVVPLMWALPGVIVLLRARWHPVGWMLILTAIGFGLSFDLSVPVLWDSYVPISRPWAAWIADSWGVALSNVGMIALLCVFPDGLGPTGSPVRKWRVARVGASFFLMVISAFSTTVGGYEGNTFPVSYQNPTGLGFLDTSSNSVTTVILQALIAPLLLLFLASLWSLWRQSRVADDARHRQYTWVLFPFGALVLFTFGALALNWALGDWVWLPVVVGYLSIPVAFSIALLRYRWFDIDKVVSRTVSYTLLAVVLVAIYAVPVIVIPEVLGLSSDLTVAASTLAAAAAFAPLRRRIQRRVDRRFNRAHYDAERLLAGFSDRLQTLSDPEPVVAELGAAAADALHPRLVAVWLRAVEE